jgi:hypothetical protein
MDLPGGVSGQQPRNPPRLTLDGVTARRVAPGWLSISLPPTKEMAGYWTRRRAFAQLKLDSNVQILPVPL